MSAAMATAVTGCFSGCVPAERRAVCAIYKYQWIKKDQTTYMKTEIKHILHTSVQKYKY